jgi:hypothetical protein
MELKELEKLIKLCHNYYVKSIATPEVSLTLESIIPPKEKAKAEETKNETQEPQYTDEDILMWSAGQL